MLSQVARLLALAFRVSDVPLGQPAGGDVEDVADCHDGLPLPGQQQSQIGQLHRMVQRTAGVLGRLSRNSPVCTYLKEWPWCPHRDSPSPWATTCTGT